MTSNSSLCKCTVGGHHSIGSRPYLLPEGEAEGMKATGPFHEAVGGRNTNAYFGLPAACVPMISMLPLLSPAESSSQQ